MAITVRVGILTVSDRSASGEREDLSGPALVTAIGKQGWQIIEQQIIGDDLIGVRDLLVAWADRGSMDLILTTGGTGFAPRDVTPEATLAAVERQAPGLAEAMRAASLKITPHAMLSRAIAGIRKRSLIVNLPGSPTAALENLEFILPALPHAIQLLRDEPDSEAAHRKNQR